MELAVSTLKSKSESYSIKYEALWVLCNAFGRAHEHIEYIIEKCGFLDALASLLHEAKAKYEAAKIKLVQQENSIDNASSQSSVLEEVYDDANEEGEDATNDGTSAAKDKKKSTILSKLLSISITGITNVLQDCIESETLFTEFNRVQYSKLLQVNILPLYIEYSDKITSGDQSIAKFKKACDRLKYFQPITRFSCDIVIVTFSSSSIYSNCQ